jgi:predicted enzyme related to lactoylglutathione lyase
MQVAQFLTILHTREPERLVSFYRDVVGLQPRFEVTPGAFMAGSSDFVSLIVEPHSEITGPARDPKRLLLNFVVHDAVAEQRRLQDNGVQFVRDATHEPGVGLFATFEDPDGNLCQLIQFD